MSGSLAHSPADVVRYLLINESQGTLPSDDDDWPVFADGEPDSPDSVITVYNIPGRQHGRVMYSGERQEHHGVEVRIRDPDSQDGYAKARAIAVALDESVRLSSVTIGASVYLVYSVSRLGDVIALGKEVPSSKRNLFTINAIVALRQTT